METLPTRLVRHCDMVGLGFEGNVFETDRPRERRRWARQEVLLAVQCLPESI